MRFLAVDIAASQDMEAIHRVRQQCGEDIRSQARSYLGLVRCSSRRWCPHGIARNRSAVVIVKRTLLVHGARAAIMSRSHSARSSWLASATAATLGSTSDPEP